MQSLSPAEEALVAAIDPAPMLAQVEAWSAINSGTGNLEGLARQAAALADAFAVLPGDLELRDPAPVESVSADGRIENRSHGRHLVCRVRANAARRVLLTGHMDTVFAANHPFQQQQWSDSETLNG